MNAPDLPPLNSRCQIYSEATSVRCINDGTHWAKWGGGCTCNTKTCTGSTDCPKDFHTWECEGPHRFGEANSAVVPTQREAA
jgi:hypothetical protein